MRGKGLQPLSPPQHTEVPEREERSGWIQKYQLRESRTIMNAPQDKLELGDGDEAFHRLASMAVASLLAVGLHALIHLNF